ncbi:uncharacterized protein LOC110990048 [Acanthaster planci]|uniref:Uncharacterized protein LOC110990048 n=1 Tax=Acanthaster planci TaxID=133434 RepID=A0A8B7ZYB1_ACAPL|nr:uncharacterized protein LOC110990048 [Acanthaster planci]
MPRLETSVFFSPVSGCNGLQRTTGVGLLALVFLMTTPGTLQQTVGVARIELCQPSRVLPSYLQEACNELLASQGTAQSAMADSGTGASPPDRRPLSDPPRYGRRSGGSPLSVLLSKRFYSLPTFKPYNVMHQQRDVGERRASDQRLHMISPSFDLLRRIASLRDNFDLWKSM